MALEGTHAAPQGQPRLALRGITKRFGAVAALQDVDFEAYPSEVMALVGDNGAGKSTLIKTIAGTHQPNRGEIFFEGRSVTIDQPQTATALGIATVYQDLALCDNLDVVANLFLGREWRTAAFPGSPRLLSEDDMEQRGREVLHSLSIDLPSLRRPVATLSGGQRQAVAVSRAVLWGSRVVLLDEPTAALGVEQTSMVHSLVRRLRDRGLAVVLISHNLSDVFSLSDRITVLRLGHRVGTWYRGETTPEQVVGAITGGRVASESMAS